MRTCIRCGAAMTEGCDIKIEGAGYGAVAAGGTGVFAKRLGKPQVAICPQCGEISLYLAEPPQTTHRPEGGKGERDDETSR